MTFYTDLPFPEPSQESRTKYQASLAALAAQGNANMAALQLALAIVHTRLGDRTEEAAARGQFEQAVVSKAGSPPPSQISPLSRARACFEAQEYQRAVQILRQVLAVSPKDLTAKYLLGKSYEALAVVTLRDLLVRAPDSYRAHQLLAQIYLSRGENVKALEEYREVVRKEPTLPGVHFTLGNLLWRTGHDEDALTCLAEELNLNPQHAEASAEIGTIYVSKGEAEKAIPYLEKSVSLKPDLLDARRELGRAYLQQKEFQKAEVTLKLALPIDEDGAVRYMLWKIYRELGRPDEANKMLEEFRRIKTAERKVREGPSQ